MKSVSGFNVCNRASCIPTVVKATWATRDLATKNNMPPTDALIIGGVLPARTASILLARGPVEGDGGRTKGLSSAEL